MNTGQHRSSWQLRGAALLLTLPMLAFAPGCAKDRASVEKNLMAQQSALSRQDVADRYRVGCPDLLEVTIPNRPELSGKQKIGPDGRIDLSDYGKLRIEGRTVPEIVTLLAQETGASAETINVRVVEYRSQHLLLFGEVIGWQRCVPYRGQETVLELLQRVGGITPGAEPADVYVVRPHIGENKRPQAFRVDLRAIVLKHDHRTNIRLLPFDQIYVGETRQAQIEKAIPPWLRGAYRMLWNAEQPPQVLGVRGQ